MDNKSIHLRKYLDFAVETAYLAGRSTLAYFQTPLIADIKSDNTPVTLADRRAEAIIRSRVEKQYPTHEILGEEYGGNTVKSNYRWIIDPIDGTKSFICGVPLYGVLLGLEIDGVVEVGVAYFPALDEMLAAATGEGCYWNGRRTYVSDTADLKQAVVAYTDASNFSKYSRGKAWERLQKATYLCAGWGDAYGYLLVATGRADVMVDPIMNIWDCAPYPPIFREAGGYFGDWSGNVRIDGNEGLAVNKRLLPQVLDVLGAK